MTGELEVDFLLCITTTIAIAMATTMMPYGNFRSRVFKGGHITRYTSIQLKAGSVAIILSHDQIRSCLHGWVWSERD